MGEDESGLVVPTKGKKTGPPNAAEILRPGSQGNRRRRQRGRLKMNKNTGFYIVVDARQLPTRKRGTNTMAALIARSRRQARLTGGVMTAGRGGGRK